MQEYLVGAVDWQRRWVRSVVCSNTGAELARAVWPIDEAVDHLASWFRRQRETFGAPLVVTGRCRAPWPNHLLEALWRDGFAIELYDGSPMGSLLRLEHSYREDLAYRPASMLAAVHIARKQAHGIGDLHGFVLRWSVQQARERLDELAVELQSSYPPEWDEHGTERFSPWTNLRPVVFSELVRLSVWPSRLAGRPGEDLARAGAAKEWAL